MNTSANRRPASQQRAEIERRFIAAVIKDNEDERRQECLKLPPSAFDDFALGAVWREIVEADTYEDAAKTRNVRPFFAHATAGEEYENDRDEMFVGWLKSEGIGFAQKWIAALPAPTTKANLLARLQSRRFNHAVAPVEPTPRFLINGSSVCTAGNLTNLIAQAKAGKTAAIAAMIAAAICAEHGDSERDTLGITATAPGSKRLLHFDTEQAPFDHDQLVRRMLRRAGVAEPPAWLDSYGLAGFSAAELRRVLVLTMKDAQAHGGVFAVILDGTADLVVDVNDAAECNAFVAELHALAIEHDCPIVNVVHENPGQDGGKMRGHLGSQLERKAESNLRLRKSEEITVVFSEKMRRAPILEKDGPRFRWSDADGMHVSCLSAGATRDNAKCERLRDQAEAVFDAAGAKALSWSELRAGIAKSEGIGPSGAGKRFDAMSALGVIVKDAVGLWRISP